MSNHTVGQTRALQTWLWAPLASSQPEFSPPALDPITDGPFDLGMETGMVPLAWSPLARGRLGSDVGPTDLRAVEVARMCDRITAEQGVERSAVLLAWALRHPAGVVPISGSSESASALARSRSSRPVTSGTRSSSPGAARRCRDRRGGTLRDHLVLSAV